MQYFYAFAIYTYMTVYVSNGHSNYSKGMPGR